MDIHWTLQFHVIRKDYEHTNGHSMDIGVISDKTRLKTSKWTFTGHWKFEMNIHWTLESYAVR